MWFPLVGIALAIWLFGLSGAHAKPDYGNILCNAAVNRQILEIQYEEDDTEYCGLRIVEVYRLAIGKNGKMYLHGYQVSGCSSSGGLPDFRTFRLDRIYFVGETGNQYSEDGKIRKANGWDGCYKDNCFIESVQCE